MASEGYLKGRKVARLNASAFGILGLVNLHVQFSPASSLPSPLGEKEKSTDLQTTSVISSLKHSGTAQIQESRFVMGKKEGLQSDFCGGLRIRSTLIGGRSHGT